MVLSILWDLANGAIKLRWDNVTTDSGAVQKGLAAELGLTGSTGDRRAYKAVLAKNGQSVDAYAHDLWQGAEWGQEVDDMTLKDMALEVLQSTPNGSIALKELADMSGVQADLEAQISLGKGDIQRKLEEVDANLAKNAQQMADFRKRINDTVQKLESGEPIGSVNSVEKNAASSERNNANSHNSSSGSLLQKGNARLSGEPLTPNEDVAKVSRKTEIAKNAIRKIINSGGIIIEKDTVERAVAAVGNGLHMEKSKSSQSFYDDYYEGNYSVGDSVLHLRISTHPATDTRMGNDPADHKVSIVIRKNGEHKDTGEHNGYEEIVYEPSEVTPTEAANAIVKGVQLLLDTGKYVDITGKAHTTIYPPTSIPENQISEKEIFNTPTLPTNEDVPFMIEQKPTEKPMDTAEQAFIRERVEIISDLASMGPNVVTQTHEEIKQTLSEYKAGVEELRTSIVQNAEIAAEQADIERVAKENGTWLKAPNGKNTNLTERQWVDVRTSRFKSWTGDWELAAKRVKIIDVKPRHNFNINQRVVLAKKEIIQWAKEHNIIRQLSNSNTGGKGTIGINPKSISKIVDDAYNIKDKSARQLYLNLLLYIEDIIRESALGESHLGYAKGADGARRPENGIDANVTIYRYYGAIKIGDKLQRVKTTVKKSNVIGSSNLYTYEIAKIELVDGKTVIDFSNNPSSNNSITFAKLLHNVENDKKNGEKLLDSSKIVDANGEPMVVYHGTVRSKDGKFNTFNAPNGLAWFSESKEHAMGFAGEKKLFKKRDLYSVYLNVRNPLNVGYLDIGGTFIAQDLAKTTGLPLNEIQSIVENLNPSWKWQVTNSEEFKLLAEKYGYDGFVAQEYNPSLKSYVKTYAVFNPNQIKSATENTGEYSPAYDDIRYSLNLDDVTIATPEMEAEANLYTSSTSSPTPTLHPYPSIVGYRFRYLCLNSGILSHYLRRHPILPGIVFDT